MEKEMIRKIKSPAKGQSLLEFALMLPILLLIVLGVIEFGRIFLLYTEASNAAREAARYGVAAGDSPNSLPRYLDCAEIRQAAVDTTVLSNFDPVDTNIQIAYDRPLGTSTEILGTCDGGVTENDIQQGYRIVITVTATFEPILPILPIPTFSFNPSSRRTILKDIVIQNEPDLPPAPPGCRLLQVTTNPSAGGEVTVSPEPDCGATWYVQGTPVTLSETPNSNFNFVNWGGNIPAPHLGSSNAVITFNMDDNYTAIANFQAIICYQIERLAAPLEGGDVTVDPISPENCPNGTGWTPGTFVRLNASENVGYAFVDWTDSAGTYTGSTNKTLDIAAGQLTGDRTLTANYAFTPDCYDIAVQVIPANEGTVVFNPARGDTCPGGWLNGTNVTITGVADEPLAYEFGSWGGDAASNGTANPGTLGVDGNKSISATFTQTAVVADLFIQKADSVDPATVGVEFNYTLVVGNNGPDEATNVRVLDTLPPSVTPVSATSTQGTCTIGAGEVDCTIGFLPSFSSITLDIVVRPNTVGTIQNTAFVFNNGPEIDTNVSNDSDSETTQILPSADLSVSKSGPANATVGSTMTYNIVVSNTGPSNAANVVLVDALPLTVSYLSSSTSQGACTHTGTQVTCNLGNMLANGSPVNITIQVIATTASTAVNQATVSSPTNDSDLTNNTDTASTLIGAGSAPFITLDETCASPGSIVRVNGFNWPYQQGNSPTNIYWETTSGTLLTSVSDATVTAGGGEWNAPVTIPAGASTGLHTIVAYRAHGSGDALANAFISVPCPAADLTIKSNVALVTPGPINQGDPVSFRVTITNTGSSPAISRFPISIYFNPNPAPVASSTHISNTFRGASASIDGLGAGSSYVMTITAFAGFPISGTNTVYAVVDSDPAIDGVIDETNETNNISGGLSVSVLPCQTNCGGGGSTGTGILAGQVFVPSISGELLPQPNVFVQLVGPVITQTQFTFTNNNGTYVFSNLETGSYTVSGCIDISGTTYFLELPINVVDGAVTQQDLILVEAPCT